MGYRQITLKLPTGYTDDELKVAVTKELRIRECTCSIESKSLDARKKSNIHWLVKVAVLSDELKGGESVQQPSLDIVWQKRDTRVLVVGSGPAGFFLLLFYKKPVFTQP